MHPWKRGDNLIGWWCHRTSDFVKYSATWWWEANTAPSYDTNMAQPPSPAQSVIIVGRKGRPYATRFINPLLQYSQFSILTRWPLMGPLRPRFLRGLCEGTKTIPYHMMYKSRLVAIYILLQNEMRKYTSEEFWNCVIIGTISEIRCCLSMCGGVGG